MLFKSLYLTCLLLIHLLTQPNICALQPNPQNLELNDITSLWDKFPHFINKIQETISRFRCPKGWKRLGGSCYYLSALTSTSLDVNETCNHLHSNLSNLIQIRNTVELFYAVRVLSKSNFPSLMIEIDSNLLKGRKIAEMLMDDQGRWKRMKESFRKVRDKYDKLKRKFLNRLSSTGLRILRRSKKVKEVPQKRPVIYDETDFNHYDEYDKELNVTNSTWQNTSSVIDNDQYEYEDLDSPDETDEFEQIDDIRGICDKIDWNADHNNSTVYILTTYVVLDKIVCSFSDVEIDSEYHHICEYVLDFCFANIMCGKHGQCENTLEGFKCSCSFLYGGVFCDKISENGLQIIIGVVIILLLSALSIKEVRWLLCFFTKLFMGCCKKICNELQQKRKSRNGEKRQLVRTEQGDNNGTTTVLPQTQQYHLGFTRIIKFLAPKRTDPLLDPVKRNLARNIWVAMLTLSYLSLLYISTTLLHLILFGYFRDDDTEEFSINDTIPLIAKCERIYDYRQGIIIFAPFALVLIIIFSWSVKRDKHCLKMWDGRPALIPPIEPFCIGNRFTTATVFGILAFEVLRIFEELLFSTGQPLIRGVFIELLERIGLIILVGLRYYPVLASLQLRNLIARLFTCLYIICDMIYTIVREGLCMGFLPLEGHYRVLEEAKLRKELGTWFIVYGLIKNIPHFFLLSYISAELCVRFIYDSIYVPFKKKKTIWSAPVVQSDESEFAKYYVKKLFQRHHRSTRREIPQNSEPDLDKVVDYEYEEELQEQANQSHIEKFFSSIYPWDDNFRFTTIATCTYTVAIVFLYYLACTLVFLYLTRTTGHISFIKFYLEAAYNIDLGAFDLTLEIILSAVITVIIYGFQLFIGMRNYKLHKLELYKGIYVNIPAIADNFKPNLMVSNSVHYPGFLVGYMAWGFVICFHICLFIFIGIRLLSLQILHIKIILAIVVPVLVIYFLKLLGMRSAGTFLFVQKFDKKIHLQGRKIYALVLYFSFFADCFLGIASCILRLIKATFLNIVYMARLDWSFHGRPLEKSDIGFATYVSYLHMEVACTNPVMLAFCYSLFDDIVHRRPKQCYDDECCIAPGELSDEDEVENLSRVKQDFSTTKITSKTVPGDVSKENQKQKGKKIEQPLTEVILNAESELKNSSTIAQLTHEQQSSFGFVPEISHREDLSSKQEKQNETDSDEPSHFKLVSTVEGNTRLQKQSKAALPSPSDEETSKSKTKSNVKKQKKVSIAQEQENESDDMSTQKILPTNQKKQVQQKTNTDNVSKWQEFEKDKIKKKPAVQKVIPSVSYSQLVTKELSSDDTDAKHQKNVTPSSSSYNTIGRIVSKVPMINRKKKFKKSTNSHRYDTATTEEEQATTFRCGPPCILKGRPIDSHHEDYQNTPPLRPYRSKISSGIPTHKDTNDDDSSHYSEIIDNTVQPMGDNRTFSKMAPQQVSGKHSSNQQSLENQGRNEDSNVTSEDEEDQLLKSLPENLTIVSTTDISVMSEKEKEENIRLIEKRKRYLRFRWQFLYTMLRNYHLFDLRKGAEGRLTHLYQQRSSLFDASQTEPKTFRDQGSSMTDIPTTIDQQPVSTPHSLVSPTLITNKYPSSPAERYVAIRVQMLYDSTPPPSQTPTIVTSIQPDVRIPISNTFRDQSLGFQLSPEIIVQPASESSMGSSQKQTTDYSTAHISQQENSKPSISRFISTSNQSTADYPLAASSTPNSFTFRTQMSHDQHMQLWRQNQMEKIQKKQRHSYIYGTPSQPPVADKVSTAAILTPQILSTATKQQQAPPDSDDDKPQRKPTESPFNFSQPPTQVVRGGVLSSHISNIHQKRESGQLHQIPPTPPQRMDRLDEDRQEISDTKKSVKTTSAVIYNKDFQSAASDITDD